MRGAKSIYVLLFLYLVLLAVHLAYPRWTKERTEATLGWDVSGYYLYLPALFIYKDIEQLRFRDSIMEKYHPTPDFYQAFLHQESGNYVMKYSICQAIQYAPFFFVAHLWASLSPRYEADGFSLPYQLMISLGSLLVAFAGLFFLRSILKVYFRDVVVAITLIAIVLGTNYLNYSAIDGAMTHNGLFTIYAVMLWLTIRFYEQPTVGRAMGMGFFIGLAVITRPTELLSVILSLLWGVDLSNKSALLERYRFLSAHVGKVVIAIVMAVLVGSVQLLYWKAVAGEWIVYSYRDQGFDWLRPHLWEGLFSYKSGWLVYSPMMVFALMGFYPLWKRDRSLFWPIIIFIASYIYIAFAWSNWWYGGSLGQRAMVQSYPILAFPTAAFFESVMRRRKWVQSVVVLFVVAFVYLNMWFTYQAHLGGYLKVGEMTKAYYWKTLGRWSLKSEYFKLLDTDEWYEGRPREVRLVYENTRDTIILNAEEQWSEPIRIPLRQVDDFDWVRASAVFHLGQKEWNVWKMTQFIVRFVRDGSVVKSRMIRVQRHIEDGQQKRLDFDVRRPNEPIDEVEVIFWAGGSTKEVRITGVRVYVVVE